MTELTASATPKLSVIPVGIAIGSVSDVLDVSWQLANLTSQPIRILETWLPHGRFFGTRQAFEPAVPLQAGRSEFIHRSVRYFAEPGEVVENAFLNLRVQYCSQPWRVLTRMRVECAAAGSVTITVEAVTMHQVGFAEAATQDATPSSG